MANPTLHWRMLAPVYVANGTPSGFLDAIYKMGTATTYADGSARAPGAFAPVNVGQVPLAAGPTSLGTGSAWTWNFDATTFATGGKTCCYAYPPTSTAINQQIVIGGTNNVAGAVWKQLGGDTRTVNYLLVGTSKNSGLYTSWNNGTTPFSVGDFTGFGHISLPAVQYSLVYMWECEEAVMVQMVNPAGNGTSGGIMGAYVDPLSVNVACAETDGRLYGVSTTGSAYTVATWLSATAGGTGTWFTNVGTAGDQHSVTFTPGAGTLVVTGRFGSFTPSISLTGRNGDLPQIPMQMTNGTQFIGQLRQIAITRDSVAGTAWQVGATPKGYLLGASISTASDAMLLAY